jgi:hypothetical protein
MIETVLMAAVFSAAVVAWGEYRDIKYMIKYKKTHDDLRRVLVDLRANELPRV